MTEGIKLDAVIIDLDGTLCDVTSIRYLVDETDPDFPGKKNFDAFHRRSIDCPTNPEVEAAFRKAQARGQQVIICTARAERYRAMSRWFMHLNGLTPALMLMRGEHDFRPDAEVKADMLEIIQRSYNIVEVWDDNPKVIEMWQSHGLKVNIVPGWPERATVNA